MHMVGLNSDDNVIRERYRTFVAFVCDYLQSSDYEEKPLPDGHELKKHLETKKETEDVLDAFDELMAGLFRVDYEELSKESTEEMLLNTALDSIEYEDHFEISETKFEDSWKRLVMCRENASGRSRMYAYLEGFESEVSPIILDKEFTIREADMLEIAYFGQSMKSMGVRRESRYVLETNPGVDVGSIRMDLAKSEGEVKCISDILSRFYGIISALRIWSPGCVGVESESLELRSKDGAGVILHSEFLEKPEAFPAYYGRKRTTLSKLHSTEVSLFRAFWKDYVKASKSKRLRRAIRRYNTAVCSDNPEDELVDLIICLETLFGASGFRAVVLSSSLYSDDAEKCRMATEEINDAYKLRNSIVHGGGLKANDDHVVDRLFEFVAILLRNAILISAETSESISEHLIGTVFDTAKRKSIHQIINASIGASY
jgi:hypothetical protein